MILKEEISCCLMRNKGSKCLNMRERQPVMRLGTVLRMALLASAVGAVATWTAFADQQALPNIPETSLTSDLKIPTLEVGGVDGCVIAATSFHKMVLMCGTGQPCNLACGLSWDSVFRDANVIIGSPCGELKKKANLLFREGQSGQDSWDESDSTWTQPDFLLLQDSCLKSVGCESHYCAPSITSSALAPPLGECSGFSVTNGTYSFPFLTWLSLQYYERQGLGCSGGLDNLADEGMTTWACVHSPECPFLVSDDMACFRYNHIRGEFLFWDWNSRLKMATPLAQIDASFCDKLGHSAILDARKLDFPRGVNLTVVTYIFLIPDPDTGELLASVSGAVATLGPNGCSPIRLKANIRYWLELDAGEKYYIMKGWLQAAPGPFPMQISSSMYPKMDSCDSIGITLQWCVGEGPDLDVFLFFPHVEGGRYVLDQDHWVGWGRTRVEQTGLGGPVSNLILELNDQGAGDDGDAFTTGPESVYLEGQLMPGTYAVMAMVNTGNPYSTFAKGCATMSLYSGSRDLGRVLSITVEDKGKTGGWWHAFNIIVEYDGLTPEPGQDWTTCSECGRRISYEVVDKMVNGPSVDDAAKFVDNTFNWGGISSSYPRILFQGRDTGQCLQYAYVGIDIRDVVNGGRVLKATFQVDGSNMKIPYPDQGVLTDLGPEGLDGGYPMLEGTHTWLILSEGYAPNTLTFEIQEGQMSAFFAVFLVPADGETRVVLRWGITPADLDTYIVPVGVTSKEGQQIDWVSRSLNGVLYEPPTHKDAQSPYLWWGISDDERGCICLPITNPCQPTCNLYSNSGDDSTLISIDKDDMKHGVKNLDGTFTNSPETTTFRNLLPGTYFVYINAYPPEEDTPTFPAAAVDGSQSNDIAVDIWLGDGVEVSLVSTIVLPAGRGGKWFRAGYIDVTETNQGQCTGLNRRLQTNSLYCYSWMESAAVITSPLGENYWPVKVALQNGMTTGTVFTDTSIRVYDTRISHCVCMRTCECTGQSVLQQDFLGVRNDNGVPGFWEMKKELHLSNGEYGVVFSSKGFYDKLVRLKVSNVRTEVRETFVPVVPPGSLRIVLTWNERPYDLDLWVVRVTRPLPDVNFAVFWGQRNEPPSIDPSMNGVHLDRDGTQSYGPEIITIKNSSSAKTMRVAVNVYNDATGNTPPSEEQCGIAQPLYDYSGCHFMGREFVEFWTYDGLLASIRYPVVVTKATWWEVGLVTKHPDGTYEVVLGNPIDYTDCLSVFSECPIHHPPPPEFP